MNDIQSISYVSRNAFIATLIAMLLNPMTIAIGFYLNQSLSAPKLNIEYVNAIAGRDPLLIDQTIFSEINHHFNFRNYLNSQLSEECQNWIDEGAIKHQCIGESKKIFTRIQDTLDFSISTIQSNINIIKEWDNKSELILTPIELPILKDTPIQSIARNNKNAAIEILKSAVRENDGLIQFIAKLFKEFDRLEKQAAPPRTGDAEFAIGILNTGNSDGVVLPNITLNFSDSSIFLEAADVENKYQVIKSHSFQKNLFIVDKKKSASEALDKWAAIVKSGNQEKFTITVESSSDTLDVSGRLPPY